MKPFKFDCIHSTLLIKRTFFLQKHLLYKPKKNVSFHVNLKPKRFKWYLLSRDDDFYSWDKGCLKIKGLPLAKPYLRPSQPHLLSRYLLSIIKFFWSGAYIQTDIQLIIHNRLKTKDLFFSTVKKEFFSFITCSWDVKFHLDILFLFVMQ